MSNTFEEYNNTEQNISWGNRFNFLQNIEESKREKTIANYNGALKYNLPTPQSYEYMQDSLNRSKVNLETEKKVERFAPSSAQLFTMADGANSLVMQKYFKEIAQYERSMRLLNDPNATDIKLLGRAKPEYKPDTFNMLESVAYGTLTGINQAKIGMETAFHDFFKRQRYESIMPENMKNIDWKSITDEGIRELARVTHPDNERAQEHFFRYYRRYKDIFLKEAENLFENAPEWIKKAEASGELNEFIFDVSSAIGQLAPLVASSVATGGGATLPLATSFIMQYGSLLDQYRKDPLAKQENIREAALIGATVLSALDAIGGKAIASSIIKPKSALGKTFKNWGIGAGTEGATEYVQAYPELIAQQYAQGRFDDDAMQGIKDVLNEFISSDFQKDALYQGAVGAFAGGSIGAIGLRAEYKNNKDKAKQIGEIAEAQKLAQEHPEVFQHVVGQLKDLGVTMPNIFVSAKTVDSLKQERSTDITDFDTQPLDVFLEETGISTNEYNMTLASGGALEIPAERLHKALQTDIGKRLLQENALSISNKFETDGMDSLLGALYQQKKNIQSNTTESIEEHTSTQDNTEIKNYDDLGEYSLQTEAELSPEEFAEYQNVQANIDRGIRAYNEEKYFTQQIAKDVEEYTKNTNTPYSQTQSNTLASLFMAEIKTYAENYNIPLQDAFNQRRPLFLGNVATSSDVDSLIAQAKQEAGLANFNMDEIQANGLDKRNIYGQPINNDVDLDAPVEVVTIEPRFTGQNAKVLRKRFPSKIKEQVLSAFENGIVNEDTGKTISMSGKDFHEHMKFSEQDTIDGLLQLEAVVALPELMRTAKLVESYEDKKNVKQIKKMHHFQGALRIGDKDYSVKLTVKEYQNGTLKIDNGNPIKLYHHRIEKELSPFTGTVERIHNQSPFADNSNAYTLRSLLEDVKDSEGNKFFQTEETPLVRQGITRKPDSDNTLYQTQQRNLSIDNVRSQYEGTKQWMKAPNGKDTKLTEKQWLQVRTPEFKAWFGDWENDPANASKVVDENGEPLVVYHGTKATIENDFIFNHDFIGQNGSAEGYGFYFTTDKSTAEGYTNSDNASSSLIESYLNIRKPMPFKQKAFSRSVLKKILKRAVELEIQENPEEIADYKDSFISNYADTYSSSFDSVLSEASDIILDSSDTAIDQMVEIANVSGSKKNISQAVKDVTGYDAVMANGYADLGVNGGKIYVAWFSNEIKSVDNTGSFNANDPRILYQLAYHGSPHKFDNFTLDAIGSGEGAQAHGWGLYFAKNKKTSEEYRKKLVFGYDYFLTTEDGKPISEDDKEYILKTVKPENLLKNKQDNINELLENSQSKWIKGKTISAEPNIKRYEEVQKIVADNSSLTVTDLKKRMPKELLSDFTYFVDIVRNEKKSKRVSALEILDEIPRQIEAWREREIKDIQERQENIDRLEHLKKQNIHFEAKEKQGQLFEVDIPENNVLLDEQKTFYKQPAKVKKALEKLYADNGKDIHEGMTPFYQPTGEEIYSNIKHYFANNSAEKASKLLNEYGIKGITYNGKLDGRCFVVFDDKAISVLETYYQKQNEAKLAEERLQEDLQAWDSTVEKFLNKGLNPRKPVIMLKNTPLVLTLLGADKNLTVSTNYSTLNKVLREKHKLPADIMKQVPQAMTDPIMIFKSATVANDYVMMLDLKDENGASIVVPVSLNYDGIANYTVNYVPSVYPQKNTETNKPKNMWFINQIENGNLVYYNKEKSREWRTSSGLQLPRVGSDLITHGRNKHILTDADLSRVKNDNPEYYHAPSPRGLIRFDPKTQQAVITVFQDKKNLSTLLHETGHFFLQNLAEAYKMENAPLIVG